MKSSLAVSVVGMMVMLLIWGCSGTHNAALTDCRMDKGPCVKRIMPGDITAAFDIQPKPVKMMSVLFFSLSLSKGDRPMTDGDVLLSLTMPGMYMGEHRIVMSHKGGGRYEGSSVIPRCPSGKRIWKAAFVITGTNTGSSGTVSAEYTFEVKDQ
jgi:hypothetical protein